MSNDSTDDADEENRSPIDVDADRRTTLKGLGAAGLGLGLTALSSGTAAASQPADKIGVAGSTIEVMEQTENPFDSDTLETTLLSGTMKTSSPTDLLIQPTAETSLLTTVKTEGNDQSRSSATVTCWIELDGDRVVVANDYEEAGLSKEEASEVVFDKRTHQMTTSNFDDRDATIKQFLQTRSANGFNWITLDVGNGEHTLEFKGRLDVNTENAGNTKAVVGPRTLIVEPVKLANDASM